MAEPHPIKQCLGCNKPFEVLTNNRGHAKYCSRECRRKARRAAAGSGQRTETTCLFCGKPVGYLPSQGLRKFCGRECKHAHWKTPSSDRGFEDLTGRQFGRWTVLEHVGLQSCHHKWRVQCACDAKTIRVVTGQGLKRGDTKSCGCIAREGQPRPETKRCRRCHRELPFTREHFQPNTGFRWGLAPCCRQCHHPIAKTRHLQWRRKLKREVLGHYSNGEPKCSCCGVDHIEFLTIDHVNNDGSADRLQRGAGTNFYALLKRQNYPNDPPLTVLCFNCNLAKAMFGQCPHQR